MVDAILSFHRKWGYAVLVLNGLAGLYALGAWRFPKLRGRAVWYVTIFAESAMLLQIVLGAIAVASDKSLGKLPHMDLHMFYGFVSFITIGLLFQFRGQVKGRGRRELMYGLGGLFLMGLAIRGILQVAT